MAAFYDTVVVGAGIQGCSAAYHLAKCGVQDVLLLEHDLFSLAGQTPTQGESLASETMTYYLIIFRPQFERNHSRGSSHGHTRITRMAYKKPFYVKMMRDAFQQWSDLERLAGATLFKNTGYLVFGRDTEEYIVSNLESLRLNGIPHQTFSGLEAKQRYPRQLMIPSTYKCIYEEMGGILYANRCLLAFQQEFLKLGGTLLDNHQVTEIIPGDLVTVVTNRGSFKANNVVIAAGPWAPALCASIGVDLPFRVKRVESLYWKVDNPDAYSSDVFPTTFGFAHGNNSYSIPVDEYPNMVKIGSSSGVWTDADRRDSDSGPVTVPVVADYIGSTFRGVASKPSIVDYCMYTASPDYDPVIDRHPKYKNIIIAAGFTGHGFKLSPVVGKVIAELVTEEAPSHDLHPFRISRFITPQSSVTMNIGHD